LPKKFDYTDWSNEELIKRIHELEKRKKYGLVWDEEREPEDVVLQCKKELPVLTEAKDKEIKNDPNKPTHILIEGDNYHALSVLNYTHEKSIDVIYIDPPYNTGAKDWKYNNKYIDSNDTWRHSKWISMMEKRLVLSKNLLKKRGVLIVTIDDNELCSLGLLLDEIFPEKDRATIVIKYNPAGTARNGFSRNHEYAFFILNKGQEIEKKPAPRDIRDQNLRRHGNGANRADSPTMFFPIMIDKRSLKIIGIGEVPNDDFHPEKQTIECEDYYEIWPLDDKNKEKRWYYGRERVMTKGHEELTCKWVRDRLHVYFHTDNMGEQKYMSVWAGSEYDAGAHGGSLVRDLLGKEFPFPKSIYAVKDCLNAIIRKNKKAVVLDFFAGSGTTGHASLLLNKNDNGKRQFILCTNNENDIAKEITYPRIQRVIEGHNDYPEITKIPSNLKYYRTDFVPATSTDENKEKLTKQSVEMLCLRENTFALVQEDDIIKVFKNQEKYTGILLDQRKIPAFKKIISGFDKPVSVYIFSLADDDFKEEFQEMGNKVKVCSIPEAILRVYRRNFK